MRDLTISSFFNRKMLLCIYTGFSSGLPLFFILQLLPAWLRLNDVDLKTIGFFTLVQLPYLLKFLWAPWLDKISPFSIGYRKGWLLITQLGLIVTLPIFGLLNPHTMMDEVILFSLLTAFLSATQDIAIDAYRREILADEQLGNGNSIHINAYRISSLIPGGLSLIFSHYNTWLETYLFTTAFMFPMLIVTLCLKEPNHQFTQDKKSLFLPALKEFFNRSTLSNAIAILAFIALYKLGDSLATALATPFYIDMKYNNLEIGSIAKNAALWPSILGGFLGGILFTKCGLNRALWISGFIQMFSILGFVWLANEGPFQHVGSYELNMLKVVIGIESLGVGMGATQLVTLIAKNTNPLFTATQFALFTGISAVPRTLLNSFSGVLSESLGWTNYFWLCIFLAIPGMLLLFKVAPWTEKE